MTNCPVEECIDVKELKASLRRWGGIIVLILLAIGGPSLYTWAKSLTIPSLTDDIKNHEKRLTITEVEIAQILRNTEDIKNMMRRHIDEDKKTLK